MPIANVDTAQETEQSCLFGSGVIECFTCIKDTQIPLRHLAIPCCASSIAVVKCRPAASRTAAMRTI